MRLASKIGIAALFVALIIYSAQTAATRRRVEDFAVSGVDVSAYQGNIDWETLAGNGIDFVFIKATEGSSYVDKRYMKNSEGANNTHLAVGAYHFMSFESDGKSQAENFIRTVAKKDITLPPVIDLELYGEYNASPPGADELRAILDDMIRELSEHYGRKPIIYTNRKTYSLFLSGKYRDYDIWFCDLVKAPRLPDGRRWTFWQYTHTGKLEGYSGGEKHIDLNVFNGSESEFREYIKK